MRNFFACLVCLGATVGVIGCTATNAPPNGFDTGGGGGASSGTAGGGGMGGSNAGGGGEGGLNFPTDGGTPDPQVPGEVFGHSADVLYKLEPYSKQVTTVGPFQGCSSVIDIAINKDSKIIGTTFSGIYWIDKTNAKCTQIASGSYPNSLSFVPAGTLDPNEEVLVGYVDADYVRIDTTTGQMTTIGSIGGGYISSGDIVSVKNGGTYLTVKGAGCGDCLLQVDPKTGGFTTNYGPIGFGSVFGIAFWAGSVYGFTNYGQLFEITFNQGKMQVSGEITVPNAPADLSFWGAGSTTIAPPVPPPK